MHKILLWGDQGSGRSTIAALLARYAVAGGGSVLVVDAGGHGGMHRLLGLARPEMTLVEDMGGAEYVRRLYPCERSTDLPSDLSVENLPRTCLSRRDNLAFLSLGAEFVREVGPRSLGLLFRELVGRLDDTGWWVLIDPGRWFAEAGTAPLRVIDGVLNVEVPDRYGHIPSGSHDGDLFASLGLPVFSVWNRVTGRSTPERVEEFIPPLSVFPEEPHALAPSPDNRGLPFPPDFLDPLRGLWGNLTSCFGPPRVTGIG